jgi:hypothetical protein
MREMRTAAVAILTAAALLSGATAAQASRTQTGYLTMQDGAQIKYTAVIPAGRGPFPVVLNYDGYQSGVTGGAQPVKSGNPSQLIAHGYVALGANVPGTGCSTGNFSMFSPDWGQDGYQIVEWAAKQPWSDGRIGMVGHSFAGFAEYGVAGNRPPNLLAIAPASTDGDFYRDAVYPGGIWNEGISDAFVVGQQNAAENGVQMAIADGDAECARNYALHESEDNVVNSTAYETTQHPYNDAWWKLRAQDRYFPDITVPVLATSSFQDGIAGSNVLDELPAIHNHNQTWYIGGSGNHDEIDPPEAELFRFFDHYLKDVDNGWQQTPHIQLWQDDQLPSPSAIDVQPAWSVTQQNWPLQVQPFGLYLRAGDALSTAPPTTSEAASSYPYPRLSGSTLNDATNKNLDIKAWKLPIDPSGAAVFTSAPLPRDVVVAGPASVDLWVSTTAPDTDLQATITEVLPSGQEMYIQRGWLRLSHRKLDAALSTPLYPYHPDQQQDQLPVTPGQPTFARLLIFPFSQAFRRGARIRLTIDAPTNATGVHVFSFLPDPATNTIIHDPAHESILRLGLLPGVRAGAPLPPCDAEIAEPCRPDPFAAEPVSHDPIVVPTAGCPLATGVLRGARLGQVELGMTRGRARRAYTHSSTRGRRYQDFFCLTPRGVRVGYASPALLGALAPAERGRLRGRVVWASTADATYAINGVRPGTPLAAARRHLRLAAPFRVGRNAWYLAPAGPVTAVLKVRTGRVEEIGIADRAITTTRARASAFLRSF